MLLTILCSDLLVFTPHSTALRANFRFSWLENTTILTTFLSSRLSTAWKPQHHRPMPAVIWEKELRCNIDATTAYPEIPRPEGVHFLKPFPARVGRVDLC